MYHLTKEFVAKSDIREQLFNDLITSDYSRDSLLKYKEAYEADFLQKAEQYELMDLGYNLRHMLAAMALKGNMHGLKILSYVLGGGSYFINNDWFEYSYADILAASAKLSDNKKVLNNVLIKNNKLYIDIKYSGLGLPKIPKGFCGVLSNRIAEIKFSLDLIESKDGKRKAAADYLYDRLSPVSLSFI